MRLGDYTIENKTDYTCLPKWLHVAPQSSVAPTFTAAQAVPDSRIPTQTLAQHHSQGVGGTPCRP